MTATRHTVNPAPACSHMTGPNLSLLNKMPLATVLLATDGRVLHWNPAAEELLGWYRDEVLGKPLPMVGPDRQIEFHDLLEKLKQGEALQQIEVCRYRRDGYPVWINLSSVPPIR